MQEVPVLAGGAMEMAALLLQLCSTCAGCLALHAALCPPSSCSAAGLGLGSPLQAPLHAHTAARAAHSAGAESSNAEHRDVASWGLQSSIPAGILSCQHLEGGRWAANVVTALLRCGFAPWQVGAGSAQCVWLWLCCPGAELCFASSRSPEVAVLLCCALPEATLQGPAPPELCWHCGFSPWRCLQLCWEPLCLHTCAPSQPHSLLYLSTAPRSLLQPATNTWWLLSVYTNRLLWANADRFVSLSLCRFPGRRQRQQTGEC